MLSQIFKPWLAEHDAACHALSLQQLDYHPSCSRLQSVKSDQHRLLHQPDAVLTGTLKFLSSLSCSSDCSAFVCSPLRQRMATRTPSGRCCASSAAWLPASPRRTTTPPSAKLPWLQLQVATFSFCHGALDVALALLRELLNAWSLSGDCASYSAAIPVHSIVTVPRGLLTLLTYLEPDFV